MSGMAAFWALQHSPHDVHLFESTPRTGTLTQPVVCDVGERLVRADAGLTVFNPANSRWFLLFTPSWPPDDSYQNASSWLSFRLGHLKLFKILSFP